MFNRTLSEHRGYVSDTVRIRAYAEALTSTVTPADIVLDLGCGTGVLGLLACRAGAARVYAIDAGPIIQTARRAAVQNGYGDRIVHIEAHSRDVTLPEPVSVVVADQLGPWGLESAFLEFTADALERLAGPEARSVPSDVSTWFAPVAHPHFETRVAQWSHPVEGVDVTAFRHHAANTVHLSSAVGELLSRPVEVWHAVASPRWTRSPIRLHGNASWDITAHGTLNALAGWFHARLAQGIVISNGPGVARQIDRPCAWIPLDPPVEVAPGDVVTARLHIAPAHGQVSWRLAVSRNHTTRREWRGSTLLGAFLSSKGVRAGR